MPPREVYKFPNATLTTRDPLVAKVLGKARDDKRFSAVLGMIVEAYLNTEKGRQAIATLLNISLESLTDAPATAAVAHEEETPALVSSAVLETGTGKGGPSFLAKLTGQT